MNETDGTDGSYRSHLSYGSVSLPSCKRQQHYSGAFSLICFRSVVSFALIVIGMPNFPCGAVGGASYVKALKAPLPQIDLVPTGGVSLATVGDFIRAGASAVGAGADLASTR